MPLIADVQSVVLGVVDCAIIAGLLASLWWVVRNTRRTARRTASQLLEPVRATNERLEIMANRKAYAALAALSGWITVALTIRMLAGEWTLAVVVPIGAMPLVLSVRGLLRRAPMLVVDGNGVTLASGETIAWDAIGAVNLIERVGSYGISRHRLVFDQVGGESVEVSLEMLALRWNDVAKAVEARSGSRLILSGRLRRLSVG